MTSLSLLTGRTVISNVCMYSLILTLVAMCAKVLCHVILYPFPIFVCSLFCLCTLTAYFAINTDPDQTTPLGAVGSGFIVFVSMMKLVWSAFRGQLYSKFLFGEYIVGYTVGNLVLRRRATVAIKQDFQTYI